MTISHENIKALCFDFGNTLIEYGPAQVAYQYRKLENILKNLFGQCDANHLKAIRDRQIVAPFSKGYRENNMWAICEELIHELYGIKPSEDHIEMLIKERYDSFVHGVELSDDVLPLLHKLNKRYRLGFLSNYPCSRSIRDSIKKVGLSHIFDVIVVSGEVGYAKPHPKPFELLLEGLGLSPSECVYIGDNWLADIQGAKGMGMGAIHTTQFVSYESFEPIQSDHMPDATIGHIEELEGLFKA